MKKRRAYSDKYLLRLWRSVVLAEYGGCAFCGNSNYNELECHHIVKVRKKILRYDVRNGIPLCKYSCHLEAHTKKGEQKIYKIIGEEDTEYLLEKDPIIFKNYLKEIGLSENEFLTSKADELKKKIMEN